MESVPFIENQAAPSTIPQIAGDESIPLQYDSSYAQPPAPYEFTGTKDESIDDGYSPESAVKAGPGRKSRACNECKRQKVNQDESLQICVVTN